jgi:hypothetical protein
VNLQFLVAEGGQREMNVIAVLIIQRRSHHGHRRIDVSGLVAKKPLLEARPQFHGQAFSRSFADPRSLAEPLKISLHDGPHQLLGVQTAQQSQAHLGPHSADRHQFPEQITLVTRTKPVELPAILTNRVMDVQAQGTARGGQTLPVPLAHLHFVTHALAHQQQAAAFVLLPRIGEFPLQPTDHGDNDVHPMLPVPRTLAQSFRRLIALVLMLVLLLPLSACSGPGQPPRSVMLEALALQIELTQASIANALALEAGGLPEVSRVRVDHQQAMPIGEAKGLRLSGQFDWRLAGDPIRVDSPFELFLQRGERGESWRLARPSGSSDGRTQEWLTYPLTIKG